MEWRDGIAVHFLRTAEAEAQIIREPTNGASDAPDVVARDWGRCGHIAAGQQLNWSVNFELHIRE